MNANNLQKQAREYLRKPYSRVLIPENESGSFSSAMLEFPGCYSQGDSAQEAYENLERAAESWIMAALFNGQTIPLPDSLHHFNRFNSLQS